MPSGFSTKKRPDYCLASSEDAFNQASEAEVEELFYLSSTVLEAKKWGHPLDRVSTTETPGLFPSQQIQDYLNCAKDNQGKHFFNWAILSNGEEWRLYCDQTAPGAYFSFKLVHHGQLCSLDDFRLFLTLFRASSFQQDSDGICFLDKVHNESLRLQAKLEDNLKKRIFGVLEDLGSSFLNFEGNNLTKDDYCIVYEKSLIFLYRLLFILYAESRNLLPVKEYGAGSNQRYRTEFSLTQLVSHLRDKSRYQDNNFWKFYEELLRLFNLINGTYPQQNKSLGVTRYNGGLFSPKHHLEIENWRIGDKDLADVLRQLIFAQPPSRGRQSQGQLSTDEAIDYSTLEVRQLGDIYESLLGAHFEENDGQLELRNEKGQNHRHGIFYTPDWIVNFLVEKTLGPLLLEVENSSEVQNALNSIVEEKQRDNSFAFGVLNLNLVDPAMGSGHFLVRATEWLANKIMNHPTTQPMTMQIVGSGEGKILREEIVRRGKIPVSPGIPQEQSEKAYWRRRVVEACIHGVDINPMAVELAKLSLWLTCIAADEPLNFLDHHLRKGNAMLGVNPGELKKAPIIGKDKSASTFEVGDQLQDMLSTVISDTLQIERRPSTVMDDIKDKEQLWKEVRDELEPFLEMADLWIATLDGLPVDEINYLCGANWLLNKSGLSKDDKRNAKRFWKSIKGKLDQKRRDLMPFHWRFEFPDVFFDENGELFPTSKCGFDAILGNPPYVSVHTAMESGNQKMRNALEKRAGYIEDLYVHFTDLGFSLLRDGGGFGFIVSDTFFTLASKWRMREMLQQNTLDWLGQCDPFDATVDAAIFVVRKQSPEKDHRFCFMQARPRRLPDGTRTKPEEYLTNRPDAKKIKWHIDPTSTPYGKVSHPTDSDIRNHVVPLSLYKDAHKRVFFEPKDSTLQLYMHYNTKVKELVDEWWEKIENSRVFSENIGDIKKYHKSLKPGDTTLVGLIAEGGQGMRTGNNACFLAYLDGTAQADRIKAQAEEWTSNWLQDEEIAPVFTTALRALGGDTSHPTRNRPAWESAAHKLREQFDGRHLGMSRSALFRIAPPDLIANEEDYNYSFQCRKAELLKHWQEQAALNAFWDDPIEENGETYTYSEFRDANEIADEDFCQLCRHLQLWLQRENKSRKSSHRISTDVLGLRSSENYSDPTDAPRIATVYNGLYGRNQFVPFRKGDPTGSRWIDNEPLFCDWSTKSVKSLSTASSARWQGHRFFLTAGVTWSAVANHVALKARFQKPCVFDADSMRLTPMADTITPESFLAILNSDVFSLFKMKFIQHTQKWEIGNLRVMPIVIPTDDQDKALTELSNLAISTKHHEFEGTTPGNDLVARVREIRDDLLEKGPDYLAPTAQGQLLASSADCLEVIEKAVNWEAEKLYGVEADGPFNEF